VIALHQGQVVFDGAASALTPALLRELYGMQADEMLMGEPQAPTPISLAPMPERKWPTPLAQAA
jgi:phosphonate transport system ATP-binding protein